MKERPDVGVYVKDLSAYVVNNADDMDRIMTLGNKNRESWSISTRMKVHGFVFEGLCEGVGIIFVLCQL